MNLDSVPAAELRAVVVLADRMRAAQRNFHEGRNKPYSANRLVEAKRLEREVDEELDRLRRGVQLQLFDPEDAAG